MSEVSGKTFDWSLLRRILSYTRPYKGLFALGISLTVTLSFLSVVRPLLIRYTMNHFVHKGTNQVDTDFLQHHLLMYCIIIFSFLIVESVFQFINGYSTSLLGQRIVRDLRLQTHNKIIHFKSRYFDQTPIGMLVTRVVSDIEAINDVFSQGFIVIAGDMLTIVVYLGAMLVVDWSTTLIVLSTVPVMFLATWWFKNAVKASFTDVRNQVARLNTFVQEHITGMKIVQVFNREKVEMESFREINKKHRDANVRSVLYYSIFFPVVEILVSISLGLLVWYAGIRIFDHYANPGDVTFFVLLINNFFRPIRMLADRINTLQMGMVSSERVFKVLDTDSVIEDKGKLQSTHIEGNISFKNVWFAYKDEEYVLRGISFDVKAGETIAI
ncbi:MAG TPA: ABC transporter transmembrane domain-containing protein, partial [Bacteroidia bacterium]|nr:ABC transporter transmembrane domain-containing protein [Bacteroidia bacterium]